jgi:tRNA A-37 threonylcarbamoyl transferase component Bud32
MSAIPATDRGLTDRLDPLLGDRLAQLRDLVDARAGVRVDDTGITVRGLLRAKHTSWERIERIELDNRLDVVLAAGTRFLPVRRLPVVGGLLTDVVTDAASAVTRRVAPRQRERLGWVVARIHRDGLLHRDIEVDGGAWLTAVLDGSVAEAIRSHAEMRHIPIEES